MFFAALLHWHLPVRGLLLGVLCSLMAQQSLDAQAPLLPGLRWSNQTGASQSGLRLQFDQALFENEPTVLSTGTQTYAPLPTVAHQAGSAEVIFSGGSVPAGTSFPDVPAESVTARSAGGAMNLTLLQGYWQQGGSDSQAVSVVSIRNDTAAEATSFEIEALSEQGTPLALQDARPVEAPQVSTPCTVSATSLTATRWSISSVCAFQQGESVNLQLTFVGVTPVARYRVRWLNGGQVTGSAVILSLINPQNTPALALSIDTNAVISSVSPNPILPWRALVGTGSTHIYACGGLLAAGRPIYNGPVTLTHRGASGPDIDVVNTTWKGLGASGSAIIPDILHYSFEENIEGEEGGVLNTAVPGRGNALASYDLFRLNGEGQFGSALTTTTGSNDKFFDTGWVNDLGSSSWTISLYCDLRGLQNPAPFTYLFGDESASQLRCFTNGGNNLGNVRLQIQGIPELVIPGGADELAPHILTFVHDSSVPELRSYLDGTQVDQVSLGSPLNLQGTGTFRIGEREGFGSTLRQGAIIDEFRVWSRALSPAEIIAASLSRIESLAFAPGFQVNSDTASLDFQGVQGALDCPAAPIVALGEPLEIKLRSSEIGLPYELFFGFAAPRAVDDGGLQVAANQVFNLSLGDPTLTPLNGGTYTLPFVPTDILTTIVAPLQISAQMLVLSPALPSGFSLSGATALRAVPAPPPPAAITVETVGNNSFNSDSTRGFWRVHHTPVLPPITRIMIDVAGSTNSSHSSLVFDLDQTGMAGEFWLGNGVAPCNGTYRLNSDISCGLLFDASNTFINQPSTSGCNGGNGGFIASGLVSATEQTYTQVEFRFAPGFFLNRSFEWDMDTDQGGGTNGGAMGGLFVLIELLDGTILAGNLERIDNQLSQLRF